MQPPLRIVSSSLVEDPSTQRHQAAHTIRAALEETGCFVLLVEGADSAIDAATQQWRHFYAQPDTVKQRCQADRDEGGGWLRLRDEPVYMSHLSSAELDAPRCKEQFVCGPDEQAGPWPNEQAFPGFRRDVGGCAQVLSQAAQALLGSFEALLGQEPGFLRYEPGHLTLTSYPGSARSVAKDAVALHEHSDAVVFTLLRQTVEALQVKTIQGDWLRVPLLDDSSFLVIPGDWMELFTNGLIPAARHRVLELAADREAVAFFQNVAAMRVGPLDEFLREDEEPRYPSVNSAIPYSSGDAGVPRWRAHTEAQSEPPSN